MTVIAFDGHAMAADRQGELFCTKTFRTKIRRLGDLLVGCAGEVRSAEAIYQWLAGGAIVADFPKLAESDKACVLVAGPNGLHLYENSPHPMPLENKFFAIGSGGDAAMAAMALGFDARRAVEIACEVCTGCGGGVDVLEVEGNRQAKPNEDAEEEFVLYAAAIAAVTAERDALAAEVKMLRASLGAIHHRASYGEHPVMSASIMSECEDAIPALRWLRP